MSAADRDKKQAILSWVDKKGPFWDDERQFNENDYYEFEGHDVTDQGLGEAARQRHLGHEAGAFSFCGGKINFERDPLSVQHGLPEEPLGRVDVDNVWDPGTLKARIQLRAEEPRSWFELIECCRRRFRHLVIADAIVQQLIRETYHPHVARRTIELLSVLERMMEGRDETGSLNQEALSLWQSHCHGDKALFSDESDSNKEKFRNELTFLDPVNGRKKLFCTWHGKIKTPQFRIHFEWPVPVEQCCLKVLYIGPKITKN
jgi:hypothetical protein